MTQDKLTGGTSSDLPPSTEVLRSGVRKLGTLARSEDTRLPKETDPAPGPLPGQTVNIDLLPVELRLQIIQRERSRKELFRRKNKAAAIIQRAWRRYEGRAPPQLWLCGCPPPDATLPPSALGHFLYMQFYLFMASLGLHSCMGFFLVEVSGGYSLVVVGRLLTAVASRVAEHVL